MQKTEIEIEDIRRKRQKLIQRFLAPSALVILYIYFGIFGRNFFSYQTLVNIIDASYYIGFIAIGVTFVIITGGIDLSVGTVMMSAAIIGGTAFTRWGWPIEQAMLLIMVVATLYGIFNGIMVAYVKMPPFIVTLGTMMTSMGIGSMVANVRSAAFPSRRAAGGWFRNFFKYITEDNYAIPTGAILLLIVVIVCHVILTRTKMGRYIFAIGSNKEAARLSGVNTRVWEMSAYIVAGVCAGIGGIAFAATYTTVMPSQGQGFELFAIAAAVIGGTSLSGGVGSVFGTLIGVFIMAVLSNGLPSMGLQAHYQTFFTGVVVIAAVLLDMYRNNRATKVHVLTAADKYRTETLEKVREIRESGDDEAATTLEKEMNAEYARLKREERGEAKRVRAEEKAAEKEFKDLLKKQSGNTNNPD
ncbi:MAG: ABC transporter permease [Spirochaetaceae bacterium]|nr:MAG: ABC transporter permease [Spirochaetaceae bacterium]